MKLRKVIISGFRSIKRTEPLIIDTRTTIFIGANDHGKSNLLRAILRLNDDTPITDEDINWWFRTRRVRLASHLFFNNIVPDRLWRFF